MCLKMTLCPVLKKKCQKILILNFTFKNNIFTNKYQNRKVKLNFKMIILKIIVVYALILKIKKKINSDCLSPWYYFYKTTYLILSQFLNIKTTILYSSGSINQESPVVNYEHRFG